MGTIFCVTINLISLLSITVFSPPHHRLLFSPPPSILTLLSTTDDSYTPLHHRRFLSPSLFSVKLGNQLREKSKADLSPAALALATLISSHFLFPKQSFDCSLHAKSENSYPVYVSSTLPARLEMGLHWFWERIAGSGLSNRRLSVSSPSEVPYVAKDLGNRVMIRLGFAPCSATSNFSHGAKDSCYRRVDLLLDVKTLGDRKL
ncbi:unnamed protein product [Microthlaspi erraticum]|uniref:Uncharacterized protein n=1 Tax=Microthlaspi erraticum TaxID=1685480 RepID=A0A6D2LHT9_9BRAS|nr:unnamed protein product [Microthlaspi erraticum]CAA7060770.1 unnamed protein product [Microthlaspi erraticum]